MQRSNHSEVALLALSKTKGNYLITSNLIRVFLFYLLFNPSENLWQIASN